MDAPLVLVVEDNPSVSGLIRALLEELGCRHDVEVDGKLALRRIQKEKPALVVLDMRLPGLDGLQVVRELRRSKGTASIPIIGVTGYTHAMTRKDALGVGCDAFFEKPFELKDFRACVSDLLSRSASS